MKEDRVPEQKTPSREIAGITIYPAQGRSSSMASHLSALAAYSRSLLHALPPIERRRYVIITNQKSDVPVIFDDEGIEVRELWNKGDLLYFWHIIKAIKAIPSIRVVHLQHEFNQFGGTISVAFIPFMLFVIRFILRKKVVVTFHEVMGREMLTPELTKKFCLPIHGRPAWWLFRAYYRTVCFCCDTALVQHRKFKDRLVNEIGFKGNVQILPIGTEDTIVLADRAESRKKYGFTEREKVLLIFGSIDWRKGIDILVDAFNALPNDYHLIIAGGQPTRINFTQTYRDWYQSIVEKINGNPRVKHIGFVEDNDVPLMFAASDLVVLPYVVPQMVSAVLNHSASYERPFIASTAFDGHADPLVLFKADVPNLTAKIIWAFEGHTEELLAYSRRYKNENSWTRSAVLLSGYYADTVSAD